MENGDKSYAGILEILKQLKILEGGSSPQYYTILQGGDQSADITYTLPATPGSNGNVLTTNGSGVLSWTNNSSGVDHTAIANIGANTHAQIDTHLASTSNPHSVTAAQAGAVAANTAITGATKTKITYDAKGLVTAGDDATTADIADSSDRRYCTDAQKTIIGNTSGTNTGDETQSTIKTKLGAASTSADGYLSSTDWNTFNGKQASGNYVTALTGDVTATGPGSAAATIANDAVTYAKMQNVSGTDKLLGRASAGAGDVEEISCTAAGRALLDDATAEDQRTTLGLGTIATQAANNVNITGGAVSGITDLAVADGGTGASSLTAYAVLCGGTTSTGAVQPVASVGTAGQVLTSNGAGALPTFQAASVPSGGVVQVVNYQTGASTTGTTEIPADDTIPQNTEGDEYMTLAITPTSATNKLKIDVVMKGAHSTNMLWIVALFQDTTANALAAVTGGIPGGGITDGCTAFSHWMTAGTTSSTTFKVRAGGYADGGTFTFNGSWAGTRLFGGVCASSITITEIKV